MEDKIEERLVEKYLDVTKTFDDEYKIYNRDLLSPNWIKFNQNIANSLSYLYTFSIPLLKKLKAYEPNFDYSNTRYYSFYFDFIVSKPSNTIFTETPKDTKVNLFPLTAKGIISELKYLFRIIDDYSDNKSKGKNLLKNVKYFFSKLNIDDTKREEFPRIFNRHFQIFFHRSFLYYDFIYYKDEGIFSKSEYSKELFDVQRKTINELINKDSSSLDDMRNFFNKAVIVNISQSLGFYENDIQLKKIEEYKHNDIFESYVAYQKFHKKEVNELVRFEVFSYVLANKIWKMDRFYQNRLEEFNVNNVSDNKYIEKMKKYINDYLDIVHSYYIELNDTYAVYEKISDIDKEILEYLYDDVIQDIQVCDTSVIPKMEIYNKTKINNNLSINSIVEDYAIDLKKYEKFKFHRILENANKDELIYLTNEFYNYISEKESVHSGTECNIYFIGILRSGSFLAHVMNVLFENDKIVTSVITYPYLSILPRNFFSDNADNKKKIKSIYIDEAIKSGYSVNTANIYRKKFLLFKDREDCDSQLYTLVNFKDYDLKSIEEDLNYSSYCDIKIKENRQSFDITCSEPINNKEVLDWKKFINELSYTNEEIKKTAILKTHSLDITKIIADSYKLFYIASVFSKKMHDLYKDYKVPIVLYAGSSEGKLLIDTTIFVYKIMDYGKQDFIIDTKNISNQQNIKLFFDISYVSGRTCEKIKETVLSSEDNFSHNFIIALEEKNIDENTFTSIFTYKQTEE